MKETRPIYVFAPGARKLELDSDIKAKVIDYNSGKVIQDHLDPDIITIRGKVEQGVFKSLLKNAKDPVLVTGDMSLTESLHFNKIPLYDCNRGGGGFGKILYAQYEKYLCFAPDRLPSDFSAGFNLLSDPQGKENVRALLQKQYLSHANSCVKVADEVEFACSKILTGQSYERLKDGDKSLFKSDISILGNNQSFTLNYFDDFYYELEEVDSKARFQALMSVNKDNIVQYCDINELCDFLELLDEEDRILFLDGLGTQRLEKYQDDKSDFLDLLPKKDKTKFLEEKDIVTQFNQEIKAAKQPSTNPSPRSSRPSSANSQSSQVLD